MSFNTRWNIKRARETRNRNDGFECYYDQACMEEVIWLSRELGVTAPFAMRCTFDFADTGETFGIFRQNAADLGVFDDVEFVDAPVSNSVDGVEDDDILVGRENVMTLARDQLELTRTEAWLAEREGTIIPSRPFQAQNQNEWRIFDDLLQKTPGHGQFGGPDFDALHEQWENQVLEQERALVNAVTASRAAGGPGAHAKRRQAPLPVPTSGVAAPRLYRKTVHELERHYDQAASRLSKMQASVKYGTAVNALGASIRVIDLVPRTGASQFDRSEAPAAVPPGDSEVHVVSARPLPMLGARTLSTTERHKYDAQQPVLDATTALGLAKIKDASRRLPLCKICGHFRDLGLYADCHDVDPSVTDCSFADKYPEQASSMRPAVLGALKGTCPCADCKVFDEALRTRFGPPTATYKTRDLLVKQ